MQRFHVWLAVGGLTALTGLAAPLAAQGFSVNEHSTCAMGRAGTATAMPCPDGSAIVFNPAGLASLGKGNTVVSIGGTFIAPSGGFTEDATGLKSDLNDRVYPVPSVYLTHGFSDKLGAGIGLFAPYGLTTDWPKDAIGRFASYKAVIRNIYVQPTLAYKIGDYIKIGAGFDINFVHLELRQRVDLSEQALPPPAPPGATFANLGIPTGTDFADAKVSGSKTGFGYHVGIIIEPTDRISLGARYLSRQKIDDIEGDAEFRQVSTGITLAAGNPFGAPAGTSLDQVLASQFQPGGLLVDQGGNTGVRIPEQFSAGIGFKATDNLRLFFDWQTQNWEVWETIVLDFELLGATTLPQEFERTHAWRFGGEYDVGSSSVIRLGYITHTAAAPKQTVTPTLPEGPRAEFTAGFGTRLGSKGHVDLAYQYIDQADRRGRSGGPGTPNNGLYEFSAHLVGATLTWTF
jgi:long-chain fatty acid transport protein